MTAPTTTGTPTLEGAILALAEAHETRDWPQWLPGDAQYGGRLAGRLRAGLSLPDEHARAAHRMLTTRYAAELRAVGVDISAVPAPAQLPAPPRAEVASRVEVTGGRIFTTTPYQAREWMKGIPGGEWHQPQPNPNTGKGGCRQCQARTVTCPWQGRRGWHYPATPRAAIAVHAVVARSTWAGDRAFDRLLELGRAAREAREHRTAEALPPVPGLKTNAWGHQRQAFWFGAAQDSVLLDMEMGTGKSLVAVALTLARLAGVDPAQFRAIIVCPERVVGVWDKQFRLHAETEFHVVDGRRENRNGEWRFQKIADRVQEFDRALHECRCGRPHVVVANYAASVHEPFKSWALAQTWDVLILDEIHKIKQASGQWSKWCGDLGKRAAYRMGLTGTLMPHTPLDVFGQIRALDPAVFGHSYTKFRAKYAIMGGYEGREVVDLVNERDLADRVSHLTYRVGAEVLDLPPAVPDVTYTCQLDVKARKVYTEVEQEFYAEVLAQLQSGASVEDTITAKNVLVKMLRLQQITGGAVKLDSGIDLEIDSSKAELLEDVLTDISPEHPVIVFCKFRHDLDVVQRVVDNNLGRRYAELSGRRSDALTKDATLADGVQVAGVQIQAGGTGIDFTRSHYAVYYSLGHSLGDYLQSRKRLDRPGQTESVRFLHLTAEATIDSDVYAALAAREQVAAYVGGLIRDRQAGKPLARSARAAVDKILGAGMADSLAAFAGEV